MLISSRSKNRLTWGLALLIPLAIVIASISARNREQSRINAWVDQETAIAADLVREQLNRVFSDLDAVAAFTEQTQPTNEEFQRFVERIGGTDDAVALGYVLEVPVNRLDDYVGTQGETLGESGIFGYDGAGNRFEIDVAGRTTLYPVQTLALGPMLSNALATGEIVVGLDAGWDPDWRRSLRNAVDQGKPTLSQFISVNVDQVHLDGVFFASVPVETTTTQRGMVMAMMVESLLLDSPGTGSIGTEDWEVVTPGSSPTRIPEERAAFYPLEVGGTTWSLALAPNESALDQIRGVPWWVVGLTSGFGAAALVIAILLYLDRRSHGLRATRAERIAADKDRFLASVSHELRTPLTVVSGLAAELRDRGASFDPAEQQDLTQLLAEGAEELTNLVEDLLVAARTDIGDVSVHIQEVSLETVVRQAIDTTGVEAELSGNPGLAQADQQRVRQIIRNLLSNARRYGGPNVRIMFDNDSRWANVTIADDGEGIPTAEREVIFESYQSAHEPRANTESIGLGLYVSRALARAMRGDLTYTHDGEWSRFTLRLHASASSPPAQTDVETTLVDDPV